MCVCVPTVSTERCRLSPGLVLGGCSYDYLLLHGVAVVRGSHGHLHRPYRLTQDGDGDLCPRRGTQIPGRQVSCGGGGGGGLKERETGATLLESGEHSIVHL